MSGTLWSVIGGNSTGVDNQLELHRHTYTHAYTQTSRQIGRETRKFIHGEM